MSASAKITGTQVENPNLAELRNLADQIRGSSDKASSMDLVLQKTNRGGFYTIKQHDGALRNALVKVAVGLGAIFGVDLHLKLNCPSKERTAQAAQLFNNLTKRPEDHTLNSVLGVDVLTSFKTDVQQPNQGNDLPDIPIDKKGNLKNYILAKGDEPTNLAKETFAKTGLGEDFIKDDNCRSIYNLVLESRIATHGQIGDYAHKDIDRNKQLLEAVGNDKDFATELCEIEKTVNSAVRRMGPMSRESEKDLSSLLVEVFPAKLFEKDQPGKSNYRDLRESFFKLCVAKALHEVKLNDTEDLDSLTSILSKVPTNESKIISSELEGVLYLLREHDEGMVSAFRRQVASMKDDGTASYVLEDKSRHVPLNLRNKITALKP